MRILTPYFLHKAVTVVASNADTNLADSSLNFPILWGSHHLSHVADQARSEEGTEMTYKPAHDDHNGHAGVDSIFGQSHQGDDLGR